MTRELGQVRVERASTTAGVDRKAASDRDVSLGAESFVDRKVPFFTDSVTRDADLPMLVTPVEHEGHGLAAAKFLTAADLDPLTLRRAQRDPDGARTDAAFMTLVGVTPPQGPRP